MGIFKRVGFLLLVVALLLGLTMSGWGCAREEVAPPEKPPAEKPPTEKPPAKPPTIKVGILGPKTGRAAAYGEAAYGAAFLLEQATADGGIKSMGGAKIEYVWGDTESSAEKVIGEMERLVTVEKVDAIITPCSSTETLAGAPVFDRYKIPVISTIATAKSLFEKDMKYWRTCSVTSDDLGGRSAQTLIDLIDEYDIKHDRLAMVYADVAQPLESYYGAMKLLKKAGLDKNVVYDRKYSAKPSESELSSVALEVKASNPDVLLTYNYVGTEPMWWKVSHEVGLYPPIVITCITMMASEKAWQVIGEPLMMEMVVEHPTFHYGVAFDEMPHKPFQDFIAKYKPWIKAKGITYTPYHLLSAQAADILCQVWEGKGTKDPEIINEALRELELPTEDLIVPLWYPYLKWTSAGEPLNARLLAFQWQDHKLECIYPKEFRTAEPILP